MYYALLRARFPKVYKACEKFPRFLSRKRAFWRENFGAKKLMAWMIGGRRGRGGGRGRNEEKGEIKKHEQVMIKGEINRE